jgi:hypothetical protein
MPPKLSEMTKMPQKNILMTEMPRLNDGNATLFLPILPTLKII